MKTLKFITPLIIAAITCVTIYSCSKSDPYVAPVVVTDTTAQKINILASQFDPSSVNIVVGTKITCTNTDAIVHSVVSDDGISFNSGNISAGGSFSFTPSTTGNYNYHCAVHPAATGVINVVTR